MNWFKRTLVEWLTKNSINNVPRKRAVLVSRDEPEPVNSPSQAGLNFILYKAVGGHILECRNYNHLKDRHEGTLYMIHEDDDFARQVAQSIMLETMKQ